MQTQNQQRPISTAVNSVLPEPPPRQTLYTVEQFAAAEPAFTAAALRNVIFKAATRHSTNGEIPGNGLIECGALIRSGRKVLIDGEKFLAWVRTPKGVANK